MQGYEARRSERIADALSASALAVSSDRLEWLLLTVDCIGLDRRFTSRTKAKLAESLAISPDAVSITCSHTHSGPATLPRLGDVEADQPYLAWLEQRLLAVAKSAADAVVDVEWRFGIGLLSENINRRLRRKGLVEFGVDPAGPVDSRLRVVGLNRKADSSPLAFIVHYACHATASGGVPHISADWPGAMRSSICALYDQQEPPVVCFLQGCAGDITHRIGRHSESWPEHFAQHTAVQSQIMGRLGAAAAMAAHERSVAVPAETVATVARPLSLRYRWRPEFERTHLQVIRIGASSEDPVSTDAAIWMVMLPGEPFAEYGTHLAERLGRELGVDEHHVLVCGYSNDSVGYLPTRAALHAGGYEVARAHHLYGRPAPFAGSTERRVLARASAAAAELRHRVARAAVATERSRPHRHSLPGTSGPVSPLK
jgi:hypothetical protein